MSVIGWKLGQEVRVQLLERFAPHYADVIADHVTLRSKVGPKIPIPGEVEAKVVGRSDDGDSLEALVVAIDGSTDRPDGSTYHITWSLNRSKGRTPRQSNDVIRELGWQELAEPVPIHLVPARF